MLKRIPLALAAIVFSLSFTVPVSHADQKSFVFYYVDGQYLPVVDLKQLEPMTEGLKAILAMYALQVGAGCHSRDKSGLKCELTSALNLGAQCSKEHLGLVHRWFKKELPLMGGYPKQTIQKILKSGEFKSICYNSPDTATYQRVWQKIEVNREGDLVSIDASCSWMSGADGPFGKNEYSTVFRIGKDEVTIVSHEEA